MSIFYKYYSYLPPEYFEEPTIKIASPQHLNDPFESLLPADIKEYIEQFAEEHEENLEYSKEDVIKSLNNVMRAYGITSFSETQRNLLMWAHYANQHQGICIGYDIDMIFSDRQRKFLKSDSILRKVNYDTVRHEDFGNLRKMNGFSGFVNYILMKIMLTKGNDWIYEKEHRYIINIDKSDHVKLSIKDIEKNELLKRRIKEMLDGNAIVEDRTTTGNNEPNTEEIITYVPNMDEHLGFGYLSLHKEASYFIKINPKCIKRIYFGARMKNEYLGDLFESIFKNKNIYDGIHINRMQLDKKRFELRIPTDTEQLIEPDVKS